MKNIFHLILILFIYGCGTDKVELTVMTWNIWHGGLHGSRDQNFEKDSSHTVNTLKVIQQQNPDILFMQETYCCGMDIAKNAGFTYSVRGSSNLSIHSKFPIVDTIDVYKPFNSHAVKVNVFGQEMICLNVWLHYLPDYFNTSDSLSPGELIEAEKPTRYAEIREILSEIQLFIRQSDSVPVIVGGDFNSGSHFDWINATKEFHHNKIVAWPVSKMMVSHGFTDSFRELHPDPLKFPGVTWGGFLFGDLISDRIDYIYFQGNKLVIVESRVVKDDPPDGFFNSDHRAVLTKFKLSHE